MNVVDDENSNVMKNFNSNGNCIYDYTYNKNDNLSYLYDENYKKKENFMDFMDYMDYSKMMNLQLFLMDEEERLKRKNKQHNNNNNNGLNNFIRSDLFDYEDDN